MTTNSNAGSGPVDRKVSHHSFLGREVFDCKTMMWTFKDGTGALPEEMRQDLLCAFEDRNVYGANGVSYLETLFAWKDRLMANY